jgi:CDP-diacylglycerol--glycerol-3-phosphate 3-phosphatidyltransferase
MHYSARPSSAATVTIYALKSRFQGVLRPIVRWLHAAGVTANQVTLTASALSVAIGFSLVDAPRVWFAIVPLWMFARMALNAVDGMLAREFGQKSALGAYLNELSDVVSDAALYLPFAFVPPFDWRSVGAVIFAAAVAEMAGVVAVTTGASRRYDGPMGKSDRAFVFSLLALWVAMTGALPAWAAWVMWAAALLAALTIVNRVRSGLRESAVSKPAGGDRYR